MTISFQSSTIRLAILVTDCPPEQLSSVHGDYETMFRRMFKAAFARRLQDQPLLYDIHAYNVTEQQYPSEQDLCTYNAFIITGSKASAYDDLPWINRLKDFIRNTSLSHKSVKFIGICFGHQIIAEALGGKVEKNEKGWEVGWMPVQLNDDGRFHLKTDSAQLCFQQLHQDIVTVVPSGFTVLASTDKCYCQVMIRPGQFLSFQFHLELKPEFVADIIKIRHSKGRFTDAEKDEWLSVVHNKTDADFMADRVLDFVIQ